MKKAKLVKTLHLNKYNPYEVTAIYEYRGHEYMIEYQNNGYMQNIAREHREAQESIDAMMDNQHEVVPTQPTGNGIDFKEIWELMGWD